MVGWFYQPNDERTDMPDGLNTCGAIRDMLKSRNPGDVLGVRINGTQYRVTDAYWDSGDGYFVLEADEVKLEGRFESGDPNDRWQMYTPEGNLRMEQAFTELAARLRDQDGVGWRNLEQHFHQVMNAVEKDHPECWDTEPRNQMKDELDVVLDELGYKPLEF